MHPGTQVPALSFGNTGDQVGGSRQSQCGRKATDDGDDLALQPERLQGFINRTPVEPPPRDTDVPAPRIAGGSDLAAAQRVPRTHDANEGFVKPHFQIDAPFLAMTKTQIVSLGQESLRTVGPVPWAKTWSCYKGGEVHCGKCGTCVERREAFSLAGVEDPTVYATNR